MVSSGVIALSIITRTRDISSADAEAKARLILSSVSQMTPPVLDSGYDNSAPAVFSEAGTSRAPAYEVSIGKFQVDIRKADGAITLIAADRLLELGPKPTNPAWDWALAQQQCQRLFSAIGYDDQIRLPAVFRDLDWSARRQALAVRMHGPVAFDFNSPVVVNFDLISGRIESMIVKPAPALPSNLTPDLSLDNARAICISRAFARLGSGTLVETEDGPVTLEAHGIGPTTSFPEGASVLAYEGWYQREDVQPDAEGNYPMCGVVVDAHDGHILDETVYPQPGGLGAQKAVVAWKPRSPWNLSCGTFQASRRNRFITVANAGISKLSRAPTKLGGSAIVLREGKHVLVCNFDGKSNVLWMKRGGAIEAARPNAPLKRALRVLVK